MEISRKYHFSTSWKQSWTNHEIRDQRLRQSFLENWSSLVIIAKCFTRMSFWMEKISYPKLWPHTRWVLIRHYPEPMARMVPKLLHKPRSCWWIGWILMVNLRMVNVDDAFVHILRPTWILSCGSGTCSLPSENFNARGMGWWDLIQTTVHQCM